MGVGDGLPAGMVAGVVAKSVVAGSMIVDDVVAEGVVSDVVLKIPTIVMISCVATYENRWASNTKRLLLGPM